MRGRLARFSVAVLAAGMLAAAAGGTVTAHPLGNFTINHYAGLRVGVDAVALDVVIDMAEIPAFQERSRIDTNADGTVDATEQAAEQAVACDRLAGEFRLTVGGAGVPLASTAADLTFPGGVGGLPTLRLECGYTAAIPGTFGADTAIRFEDRSYAERIGWREIVVEADGAVVTAPGLPATSISQRLTTYPTDLLASPLDVRVAEFRASPPPRPASVAPAPVPASLAPAASSTPVAATPVPTAAQAPSVVTGAIPGGVQEEISRLLAVSDLTPIALLGSLLVAFVLGAVHAVSPGHGKTVMAAYLVGSRGSLRHAVALGLTVTVSHTLGVLALALITVFASNIIPPERLYPILGVASGTLVIGIGLWLLYSRVRAWHADRAHTAAHRREHELAHAHGHAHEHEHEHEETVTGEHSHGPFRHSHVPPAGTTLTWRSLFTLGLAGGLVPSASALLLLLGSISANRPAYGVVLVLAFGLGMAVVLGGLGILLVHASRLLEHARPNGTWQRLWTVLPAATAVVVVAAGVYITSQALQTTF